MAKLSGVTPVNMIDGEITAIKYDGAVYSKVDGIGKFGDVLLRVKCGIPGQVSLGSYFEGHDNRSGDDQTIYYRDEDGDVMGSSLDRFVVFRKASETPQASAPYAEMVMAKVAAVEQKVAAIEAILAPEIETLKVGDYAIITGKGDRGAYSTHQFKIGSIVKLIGEGSRKDRMWAEDSKGDSWFVLNEYLRKATDADVAPAKPKTGDIVVITANTNGSRNKVGDIGIVGSDIGDNGRAVRVIVEGVTSSANYTRYDEMRLAKPAEIAQYEAAVAQASKDSVFTKAGRKPDELRKGDVVRVIRPCCAEGISKGDILEVTGNSTLTSAMVTSRRWYVVAEIVCFAEDRADLVKGAC